MNIISERKGVRMENEGGTDYGGHQRAVHEDIEYVPKVVVRPKGPVFSRAVIRASLPGYNQDLHGVTLSINSNCSLDSSVTASESENVPLTQRAQ